MRVHLKRTRGRSRAERWYWTLKSSKKPREINSREVVLDPQVVKKAQRDQQQGGGTGPSSRQKSLERSTAGRWYWTLKSSKKPREINSREVVLDPQVVKKAQRDQQQGGGTGPSREPRPDQEEGGGTGPSREPRPDQEEGSGAGLSREPREDQEQKGRAGLSREPREDQKQKGGAGPPHIQESPGEIKGKEVELGPLESWTVLCFSCSSTVAFQTLSL